MSSRTPPPPPPSAPRAIVIDPKITRGPVFRPRRYPAMDAIRRGFVVMAWLCVVAWIGWTLLMLLGGTAYLFGDDASAGEKAFGIGIALPIWWLGMTISHIIGFILFMFFAESIKIMIDVQNDTHETLFVAKADRSRRI